MAGAPRHPSSVAPAAPLDVRHPEIVVALSEAVAILDADLRPRMMLGPLGLRAGFARADDLTTRLADWIHPDDHQAVGDALERCRSAPDVDVEVRVRVHNDLDGWHTMRLGFRNLYDHPEVQGVLVRAVDETVFEREARWRSLVGESPTGIFELDTRDRCTFVNPAFARLTGRTNETALGAGWSDVFDDDDLAVMRERLRRAADTDVPCSAELRVVGDDGAVVRWVSARAVPLRDAEGRVTGFLGTLEDVTDRKRLEERLEYDATHDRLTGLGSRALLVEELQAGLARTRRGGGCVALLFIDLDGFKRVNDTLGHAAGDQLLVNVAQRLRGSVRGGDVCVRLGGDEFVVCCSNLDRAEQAIALAERMLATLSEPYDVHGHEVLVGASIGIASAHGEDPVSADQLLSNADIAAYRAKRLGRGRIEVFDDDLRRQLGKARRIGRTVSRLLDQPLVPLICTPIAHLERGAIIGFDATVDWEAAGVHEPEDAIAQVIEEAGMSRTLDLSVVRTLLAQLTEWTRRPPAPIVPGLSATLTASGALSQLVPELVRDMLARTRVAPALCWLGIPETAVAADLDAASRVAVALGELGIGVGLRDFGSAVSSLEQLRRLPAPAMTVAGPLVEALHRTDEDGAASTALLAAVVQYARALGRVVVAFGVQDAAHARRLRELGCSFGAGPAFGPRLRPDQVEGFLAARPHTTATTTQLA